MSRNGSGSNAGTVARDTESTLAVLPMPRLRMIPVAWWTSTHQGFFSGSRECRAAVNFCPDDIPDDFHPWYADLIRWVNGTVHELEKTAFYDGFYKAFGFGGYPCIWCEHQHCVAEEADGVVDESYRRKCRHMDLVRPSMEAAGIDVFATARNVGWELKPIPCKNMEYGKIVHSRIHSVGLVLIE